jgi:hypothetical protein
VVKQKFGAGIKSFFEAYGPLALLFAIPLSMVMCLLQYLVKPPSLLFLIIGLLVSGIMLLKTGIEGMSHKELRNLTSFGAFFSGAILLIWAGLLIFNPSSQIAAKTRMSFENRSKTVSAKEIDVTLDISPTSYTIGERGMITIRVTNNSKHELILDSVMFETRKKFFEGFVVDYDSAVPPISERKQKMGLSIALFFGEEQIHIPSGEKVDIHVEIVANTPGDYSDTYYAVLMVGLNSTAMPRKVPEDSKDIFLVILAQE